MNLDEVAKLIVEDANKKEFNGKTSVQAKNINTKRTSSNLEIATKEGGIKPYLLFFTIVFLFFSF